MAAAFEAKAVDVVTHVEPFATRLVDALGGVPLASNLDVWGPHGPGLRHQHLGQVPGKPAGSVAALRQGAAARRRRHQGGHAEGGRDARRRQYYRVDKATLAAALPRQKPQVDITQGGAKGMEIAIADMVQLGYLKSAAPIIDTSILKQTLG